MNVREFKTFCKNTFGIIFPSEVVFEERKEGIRAFSKYVMSLPFKGKRGILVYSSNRFTNSFAKTFGFLAKKNVLSLKKEELSLLLRGEIIPSSSKTGWYIVTYKGVPLLMAFSDGKMLYPSKDGLPRGRVFL